MEQTYSIKVETETDGDSGAMIASAGQNLDRYNDTLDGRKHDCEILSASVSDERAGIVELVVSYSASDPDYMERIDQRLPKSVYFNSVTQVE